MQNTLDGIRDSCGDVVPEITEVEVNSDVKMENDGSEEENEKDPLAIDEPQNVDSNDLRENENPETKDDDCTMVYDNNSKYNLRQRKIKSYTEKAESNSKIGLVY